MRILLYGMAKFEKKYTTEQVQEIFAAKGCELLEDSYQDTVTPMRYRCACGAESKIRLFSFQKGSRCKECGRAKMRKSRRHSFEFVKSQFESAGYEMSSTNYVDNKTPLELQCPRQHIISISYANFQKGTRCKFCWAEDYRGENNPNWNPDREQVASNDKYRRKCRSLVRRTLSLINEDKIRRSRDLLGYEPSELKSHLEQHPNMDRIGPERWVIDHIFPIKAFLDYGITDISKINSLDNLQPLEEHENLVKNDRYSKSDFEKYLRRKGINVD